MSTILQFQPFPKIARWSRNVIVTEKIDGTNGQIHITEEGEVFAASRHRYLTPDSRQNDNFGFARWVEDNKEELLQLGPGRHFGEWFGKGIQRGYGLEDRRFALFNVGRWNENHLPPSICTTVPVLFDGALDELRTGFIIEDLKRLGSYMVPGFMNPEGIVILHKASGTLYKKTCVDDEKRKSE